MPKVEFEEAEARNLQAAYNLLNRVHGDPKHSAALRAAIAELDPELKLPDPPATVQVTPLNDRLDKLAATVEGLAKVQKEDMDQRRNAAEDSALNARIDSAARRFDFNDEGRKQLIERLVAQKSTDVEGAAAIIAADNPKPAPLPADNFPHHADLFGIRGSDDEGLKMLHTDPDVWQQQELRRLIGEQAA
jgi:hypothetical protein